MGGRIDWDLTWVWAGHKLTAFGDMNLHIPCPGLACFSSHSLPSTIHTFCWHLTTPHDIPHHNHYQRTPSLLQNPVVSCDENRSLVDSSRSSRWCMLGTLAGDGIEVARPPACGMLGYRPFPATLILQGHHSVAWAGGEGNDKSRPPRPWPSYRPCI